MVGKKTEFNRCARKRFLSNWTESLFQPAGAVGPTAEW